MMQRRPLLWIGLGLVVVVVVLLIALELFGVVGGLLFMADAPLPDNVQEISHRNLAYGADEWTYTTALSLDDLVRFYESHEGRCYEEQAVIGPEQYVICVGTDEVSIFGMRWEMRAARFQRVTTFDLRRDMLWSGPAPQVTTMP